MNCTYKIWMSINHCDIFTIRNGLIDDTLLTISSLYIPILLFIIHKDMDRLSLQTKFLEPY
jgi:hypothetical protein